MNPAEFANIAEAEASFWWYRGMRQILFELLDPVVRGRKIRKVLEAGCGTGYNAATLQERYGWRLYPLDLQKEGLQYAKNMGLDRLTQGDVGSLSFLSGSFDAVVCLDVIVHFERGEEHRAFEELSRVLTPGGLFVVRVSALDVLRSNHSKFAYERQRFTAARLAESARRTGIRILRCTYANSLLVPIALAKFRLWEPLFERTPQSGVLPVGGLLNRVLAWPLSIESRWLGAGRDLPFGQSLILVEKNTVKSSHSISVFFPAYNDALSLPDLVEKTFAVLPQLAETFEVIVVNDGSYDNTGDVLRQLRAQYGPRLRIIEHGVNRGYGGALKSGFEAARHDLVFYTDGDGQYDVGELPLLVERMGPDVGLVNGYKLKRHDPWHRIAIGWLYNKFARALFRIRLRDIDCDFRLMRRDMLQRLQLRSNAGCICVELVRGIELSGCAVVEAGVHHYPRLHGRSQFFRVRSLFTTLRQLLELYGRLVLLPPFRRYAAIFSWANDTTNR